MPGPNDHHIDKNGQIQPGLGADEPSELRKLATQAAGATESRRLRDELAREAATLDKRDREVLAREESAAARLKELEEREQALAKREAELAAGAAAPTAPAKGGK